MYYKPYFPNLAFGWGFLGILIGILAVAAYVDLRRAVIPKWITLSLLGLGFAVSITRAAWLGAQGGNLWLFSTGSAWLGGVDGLVYALTGAVAGFALIFVMWILGTCGGGDVKLFTAIGAWIGPIYPLFVLLVAQVVLAVIMIGKLLAGGVNLKALQSARQRQQRSAAGKEPKGKRPPKMRVTYSLPVAVATLIVLLWVFRHELQVTPLIPQQPRVVAYER